MTRRSVLYCMLGASALALTMFAACGNTPPPKVAMPLVNDAGRIETPGAKWVLDFSQWSGGTRIDLEGGAVLVVGEGGERWVGKDGNFDSAPTVLPERILTAKKTADGFRYIAQATGAVYLSKEPLGAATKLSDGVKNAKEVFVGKNAVFAIDAKGDLMKTMDGKAWTLVDIPQRDGPITKMAMHDADGLVATVPQRFFGTKDDGVTWTPVRSPGVGVRDIVAVGDHVELVGELSDHLRFDSSYGTFSKATAAARTTRGDDAPSRDDEPDRRQRVIDGARALEVFLDTSGANNNWLIAVGPFATRISRRVVPELQKCEYVYGDMVGDTIMLACDSEGSLPKSAQASKDAGPAPKSVGYVLKLFRSDDAGKTFRLETTMEGGEPESEYDRDSDAPLAIGSDGFVYVGRRCRGRYNCLASRVRVSTNATWKSFEAEKKDDDDSPSAGGDDEDDDYNAPDALRHVKFARQGSTVYSIGVQSNEASIYKWKGDNPEALAMVGRDVNSMDVATLSVDTDGSLRGWVSDSSRGQRSFEWKDSLKNYDLPVDGTAAFAGKRGLVVSDTAYETSDGGKTWAQVVAPTTVSQVLQCTNDGCVTDGGYRSGWDGTAGKPTTAPKKEDPKPPQFMKPIKCSAKDKWVTLGNGALPMISSAGRGPNRWVAPMRLDQKIVLVTNKRTDPASKTTNVTMMEAPPSTVTATTLTYSQRGAMVAARYTTPKDGRVRAGPAVDVTIAWLRDGNAKVSKQTVPGLLALKGRDMDYEGAPAFPDIVSVQPKGVYFHPPVRDDDSVGPDGKPLQTTPLYFLRDDGKQETQSALITSDGALSFVTVGDSLVRMYPRGSGWGATLADSRRLIWSVGGGMYSDGMAVSLFDMAGKPAFAATMRSADFAPRGWAIPVVADANLGPSSALPTQKSLGDAPKACDAAAYADAKAFDFTAPYVFGSRRPVIIDIDGIAQVLGTDNMRVRVASSGECVLAMEGRKVTTAREDSVYMALIFPDDMANAMLFKIPTPSTYGASAKSNVSSVSARPMECQFVSGALPPELKDVTGFADPR